MNLNIYSLAWSPESETVSIDFSLSPKRTPVENVNSQLLRKLKKWR